MELKEIKYINTDPMPKGRERGPNTTLGMLRIAIKNAKVGQSFMVPETFQPFAYRAAQQVGSKITARKTGTGKLQIWRTK